MKIIGIDGLTTEQIHLEVAKGGKFVFYQFAVSVVFMSFKRSSHIYFVRANQHSIVRGLPYTLLSLVAGWWGIPWGPVYTVQAVWANLTGGHDVTPEVLASPSSGTA